MLGDQLNPGGLLGVLNRWEVVVFQNDSDFEVSRRRPMQLTLWPTLWLILWEDDLFKLRSDAFEKSFSDVDNVRHLRELTKLTDTISCMPTDSYPTSKTRRRFQSSPKLFQSDWELYNQKHHCLLKKVAAVLNLNFHQKTFRLKNDLESRFWTDHYQKTAADGL